MAFGVAGLATVRSPRGARVFLVGGSTVYLLLWLYGLVVHEATAANFVPTNTSDDWLHLLLSLSMLGLAFLVGTPRRPTTRRSVDRLTVRPPEAHGSPVARTD